MQPHNFDEANAILAPPRHRDDTRPLAVHRTGDQQISCWRLSWRERLSALLFGRCWLYVVGGHPPVAMTAARTVFPRRRRGR